MGMTGAGDLGLFDSGLDAGSRDGGIGRDRLAGTRPPRESHPRSRCPDPCWPDTEPRDSRPGRRDWMILC